ncbi:expressed unknown protein [Seminavis robusta]|uniref:Uncharacterized protein n=1 Tax=Seminavis robusta TaxID=568900 RepID=A0A9N8DPW3_9STRA|nr:expressed unknown protein [Seminavis robusta]|eukprot:Sro201_g084950.1 n/a (206) ;mRNA; f:12735-13352
MERESQMEVLEKTLPRSDVSGSKFRVTADGNEALQRGTEIFEQVQRRQRHIMQPSQYELETEIGKDKAIQWFGTFYKRMMADPRMAVLFNNKDSEANVSALVHGKRLALALWSRWTDDQSYYHEVGNNMFRRLQEGHTRAKQCPMRSKRLQGRGFTTAQRNSWLGHLWLAGKESSIPPKLNDQVVQHLATLIGFYGPFVEANSKA